MAPARRGQPRREGFGTYLAGRHAGEDLGQRRAVQAERRGIGRTGGFQQRAAVLDVFDDILEIGVRQDAAPPVPVENDQAIGRESCRNRGCLYVSIMMISVSLKKKKI